MPLPDELYNIKFAGYFESIREMYMADKKFKMICDDYCVSISKTKNYDKRIERNLQHKLESENLSRELEEEILFYIVRNR
ncbi:hypothetical protein [Flavobacterium sp. YJ01]|uniref:hypothetical protein n=1 Tax=unclassified Flavobacterium TaxID=196869 RepID=UPI0023E47943|nr:hypothetical protein [Flavobacterium sp. YJ01]WET03003.1 hypothetical protein P0R33_01470 [Flavobacterium sp. YJ01]